MRLQEMTESRAAPRFANVNLQKCGHICRGAQTAQRPKGAWTQRTSRGTTCLGSCFFHCLNLPYLRDVWMFLKTGKMIENDREPSCPTQACHAGYIGQDGIGWPPTCMFSILLVHVFNLAVWEPAKMYMLGDLMSSNLHFEGHPKCTF